MGNAEFSDFTEEEEVAYNKDITDIEAKGIEKVTDSKEVYRLDTILSLKCSNKMTYDFINNLIATNSLNDFIDSTVTKMMSGGLMSNVSILVEAVMGELESDKDFSDSEIQSKEIEENPTLDTLNEKLNTVLDLLKSGTIVSHSSDIMNKEDVVIDDRLDDDTKNANNDNNDDEVDEFGDIDDDDDDDDAFEGLDLSQIKSINKKLSGE